MFKIYHCIYLFTYFVCVCTLLCACAYLYVHINVIIPCRSQRTAYGSMFFHAVMLVLRVELRYNSYFLYPLSAVLLQTQITWVLLLDFLSVSQSMTLTQHPTCLPHSRYLKKW